MADFTGGPGLLAFIATFSMVLGAVLLFRSLSKHLRKVRMQPPADAPAGSTPTVERSIDSKSDGDPEAGDGTVQRD